MTDKDLEELKADLRAVRAVVERNNPLLRRVTATKFLSILSLPYAALILGFGIGTQLLIGSRGSFEALPQWWMTAFWIFLAVVLVVGSIVKLVFFRKRAAVFGTGLGEILLAVWGRDWFNVNVSGLVALVGISAFTISLGHAWYILPAATIYYGFVLNSMGLVTRRGEYFASGWYAIVMGTISLFTLEQVPWLWFGVLLGGLLLVFGVGGLVAPKADEPEEGV